MLRVTDNIPDDQIVNLWEVMCNTFAKYEMFYGFRTSVTNDEIETFAWTRGDTTDHDEGLVIIDHAINKKVLHDGKTVLDFSKCRHNFWIHDLKVGPYDPDLHDRNMWLMLKNAMDNLSFSGNVSLSYDKFLQRLSYFAKGSGGIFVEIIDPWIDSQKLVGANKNTGIFESAKDWPWIPVPNNKIEALFRAMRYVKHPRMNKLLFFYASNPVDTIKEI